MLEGEEKERSVPLKARLRAVIDMLTRGRVGAQSILAELRIQDCCRASCPIGH